MKMWFYLIGAVLFIFLKSRGMIPDVRFPKIMEPQTFVLLLHIVCCVSSIISFLGGEMYGLPSKFTAYLSCLLSSIVAIGANYGVPKVSEYKLWLSNVAQGADFPFLLISMIFANSLGIADYLGLLIISRRSFWFIATHMSKAKSSSFIWKTVEPTWNVAKSLEDKVLLISATCEIMIGIWLIIILLTPQRQFLSLFVFWNYLKLRFNAPRSSQYHQRAWSVIDDLTTPYTPSFMSTAVTRAKAWFRT